MSNKRYVKKWLPYALWDFVGIQNWLNEQAAQGLRLLYWPESLLLAGWVPFHEDPAAVHSRYCLDPLTERIGDAELSERNRLYRESGWDYVDSVKKLYAIYRCDDPAAPELYNDPQSFGYAMKRQLKWAGSTAVGWLLYAVLLCDRLWVSPQSLRGMYQTDPALTILLYLCALMLVLGIALSTITTFLGIRRIGRSLQRDTWPAAAPRRYPLLLRSLTIVLGVALYVAAMVLFLGLAG